MIFKNNSMLKTTHNKFTRNFDLTVGAGNTEEFLLSTASDSGNTKIYLQDNRIILHSSIILAWVYVNLYSSTTNANIYVQYDELAPDSYNVRGAYGYGSAGNLNICVPLDGTRTTNDITVNVFSSDGCTIYHDPFWSHVWVTALYE